MHDIHDRFTEQVHQVLRLAREEARRLNRDSVGPEHLLLGLVREGDGIAAKVLAKLGISLAEVRRTVEENNGRGHRVGLGEVELTPHTMRVIELGADEARRMNHHYIGTEHLLLGLVRDGEGGAVDALARLGVTLDSVRSMTMQALGLGPTS